MELFDIMMQNIGKKILVNSFLKSVVQVEDNIEREKTTEFGVKRSTFQLEDGKEKK